MKQTLIEKIISKKINRNIYARETAFVPIDLVMGTDGTVPLSIKIFEKFSIESTVNPENIVFVNDHFVPAKDVASARLSLKMKEFAKKHNIVHCFDVGRNGICHVVLPEKGLVKPYDIIVGADSHTCTYGGLSAFSTGIGSTDMVCVWATGKLWLMVPETIKVIFHGTLQNNVYAKDLILFLIGKLGVNGADYNAIEFEGDLIKSLNVSDRLTICNMVVEMGAKAGIVNFDTITEDYYKEKAICITDLRLSPDNGAKYKKVIEIDVSKIEPVIACPYSPANIKPAKELVNLKIDQVVIGSCTNGRIEDFRLAHKYIKNHEVHADIKLIIIPGSQEVLYQMAQENILTDFIRSGAVVSPPTCGPCVGIHMGVLANHEVGLYTTNRNFFARNGDATTKVYLCNPAIAAYSAVKGSIQIPEDGYD